MLIFPLKKQWYEKIKSGEKTIEYREAKGYWSTRLINAYLENCTNKEESLYQYLTEEEYDNWLDLYEIFNAEALEVGIKCNIPCLLKDGYSNRALTATITKIEYMDGINTDLHTDKCVYALHLADVKQKMSLQEEIKRIHDEYYNGGKFIKPSFKYIVVIDQTFGQHGDDFYVCNLLDKAKEKALELLSLTKEWVEIYEVREYKDGFKAVEIFTIHNFDKVFRESFSSSQPMHIAWRTRGDCLNEKEN